MTKKLTLVGVCGGIDSNLHVIGHPYYLEHGSDNAYHTHKEKAMTTWRYNIRDDELVWCFGSRRLNEDEIFKIKDFLVRRKFLKESEE